MGSPLDGLEIDAFLHHLVKGRHAPEPLHLLDDEVERKVDLFFCGETSDTEADGSVSELDVDAECAEHVAGLEARRGAG
mgnify:CR=1 FL=1